MGFSLDNSTYILNFEPRSTPPSWKWDKHVIFDPPVRISSFFGCGWLRRGVFPMVWACTFRLIGNLRVWLTHRAVQNQWLFHMCHTSILDVLKVLLHILEPDPLPYKGISLNPLMTSDGCVAFFHSPALEKTWFKPERWYHIHKCSFKHGKHHLN